MKIAKILLLMIVVKQLLMYHPETIQQPLCVIIIIGAKEIYQQILNVPYVERHVGPVNVLPVCDANGVE